MFYMTGFSSTLHTLIELKTLKASHIWSSPVELCWNNRARLIEGLPDMKVSVTYHCKLQHLCQVAHKACQAA